VTNRISTAREAENGLFSGVLPERSCLRNSYWVSRVNVRQPRFDTVPLAGQIVQEQAGEKRKDLDPHGSADRHS
jgi:hypothetical protein